MRGSPRGGRPLAGLWRRVACAALAPLAALIVGSLPQSTGPAYAAEVLTPGADGVISVRGHGWGHGHGLSQYGAQGAALRGVDAATILATYYPGTADTVAPSGQIRVLLAEDGDGDLQAPRASPRARSDAGGGGAVGP